METELAIDDVRRIVDLARWAPSVHNTQPWLWRARGATLELWADRERGLPVSDPEGRNLVISCGAALHHTVVAAQALGAHPEVAHLPEGTGSDLMARIELSPAPATAEATALLPLLAQRHTDRRRFTSWPVPEEHVEHLATTGAKWGAAVLPVAEKELRAAIEDLLEEARRRQQADPRIADETEAWIDHGTGDGIPTAALPIPRGAHGERPSRFGSELTPDSVEHVLHGTDGLLVISSEDDTPLAWLHAGEALSALWLRATASGLAVVPLSQVTEVPRTRAALGELLTPPARVPQLLVRVGWQEIGREELPRTPRRPVGDVFEHWSRPA